MNPEGENEDHYGSGIVNRASGKVDVDVFVRYEGAIFLFEPLTVAAQQWIDETSSPTRNGSGMR